MDVYNLDLEFLQGPWSSNGARGIPATEWREGVSLGEKTAAAIVGSGNIGTDSCRNLCVRT